MNILNWGSIRSCNPCILEGERPLRRTEVKMQAHTKRCKLFVTYSQKKMRVWVAESAHRGVGHAEEQRSRDGHHPIEVGR